MGTRGLWGGEVEVGERVLAAERVVIATGSTTAVPPIEGVESVEYWTNREATALKEVPASVAVVGGGPVAVELGQMLSRFGSEVTLIERGGAAAEPRRRAGWEVVGASLLRGGGIRRLMLGSEVTKRCASEGGVRVTVDGKQEMEAEKLVWRPGARRAWRAWGWRL